MSRWCVGSARGSPTSRPTFCRCRLSGPAARPLLVSVCNVEKLGAARRGQRVTMRLLPPLIAAALTTLAAAAAADEPPASTRSEEHTSELQSRVDLVCRLLL